MVEGVPISEKNKDIETHDGHIITRGLLYGLYGILTLGAGFLMLLMVCKFYYFAISPLVELGWTGFKRRMHFYIIDRRLIKRYHEHDAEKCCGTISYEDLTKDKLDAYKYRHVIFTREHIDNVSIDVFSLSKCKLFRNISVRELHKQDVCELHSTETCCICLDLLQLKCDRNIETDKKMTDERELEIKKSFSALQLESVQHLNSILVEKESENANSDSKSKKSHHSSLDNKEVVMLPCGHYFHAGCLREWFAPKKRNFKPLACPLCRMDLVKCKALCTKLGFLLEHVTVAPGQ